MPYVTRTAGVVTGLFRWPPVDEPKEFLPNDDPEVVTFENPPPPTLDQIYDQTILNQQVLKALVLCLNDGTIVPYSAQTVNLTVGEVVTFSPSGAVGRLLYDNDAGATGTAVFDIDSGTPAASDTMTGVTSGGDGTVGAPVINANAGTALLIALDDQGATGNLYVQLLTGLVPADNQAVYGATSDATADVAGTVASRTINNQFVGVYTGANYQTNFGIGIDSTDAIVGDKFPNLLDVTQEPPNNQSGSVTAAIGDRIAVFPWDGAATDVNGDPEPDFNQMTLSIALTGASTIVDVGTGNIPDNTPAAGFLRIERDSDNNLDLVEYASHDGDDEFTLVGTAPSTAAITNTVMLAYIDKVAASATESVTAVFGPATQGMVIKVRQGGVTPIKPFITTATFGASGFDVTATRTSDA